jgi:trehalose synthase
MHRSPARLVGERPRRACDEAAPARGQTPMRRGRPEASLVPMTALRPIEVRVSPRSVAGFEALVDPEESARWRAVVRRAVARLAGRVVWNVNSTARGGGVAEMMGPVIGWARGAGADARWLVIAGTPGFFRITKRLHNLLHGEAGDRGPLGAPERATYEEVLAENAAELAALVRPGDVVLLHDPQTLGLVPSLRRSGALVVWRCHIGSEDLGAAEVRRGWDFLAPYLREAHATVFSRAEYIPDCCDVQRARVIRPSIDPFSAKNQELADDVVRAILVQTGLVEGPAGAAAPTFLRDDGSPGRVDRGADIMRVGRAPDLETPLVVQVSRWDRLKDHAGLMEGFSRLEPAHARDAQLVLAGPSVMSVADDPDGPAVLGELTDAWRALPHERRRRVQIAALPMVDPHENAAIVNALQRHAAIVVQKSLREGFGLTVTEAMWKARPVVASAVGGIVDQIEHGRDGLLLPDPADADALAAALARLLADPEESARLGAAAHERVRRDFLGLRQLADYAALIEDLLSPVGVP